MEIYGWLVGLFIAFNLVVNRDENLRHNFQAREVFF